MPRIDRKGTTMAAAAEDLKDDQSAPYGYHKGLPILTRDSQMKNGARTVNGVMAVAPFDLESGGSIVMSSLLRHAGDDYQIVRSKDDPDVILGWNRTMVLDMIGAAEDNRPAAMKAIQKVMDQVVNAAKVAKAAKKGQGTLEDIVDTVVDDLTDEDQDGADIVNINE